MRRWSIVFEALVAALGIGAVIAIGGGWPALLTILAVATAIGVTAGRRHLQPADDTDDAVTPGDQWGG